VLGARGGATVISDMMWVNDGNSKKKEKEEKMT
jgi:hypothetical protein